MDLNIPDCHVDKNTLEEEIIKCYETGIISEVLGDLILRLIAGQLYSYKWIKYSGLWREAMYNGALENCLDVVVRKTYDTTRGNAFGYLFRTITNAFLTALNKLKRQADKMDEYRELTYTKLLRDNPEHVYVKPDTDDFELWQENDDADE